MLADITFNTSILIRAETDQEDKALHELEQALVRGEAKLQTVVSNPAGMRHVTVIQYKRYQKD